jgi:hypothetical protein
MWLKEMEHKHWPMIYLYSNLQGQAIKLSHVDRLRSRGPGRLISRSPRPASFSLPLWLDITGAVGVSGFVSVRERAQRRLSIGLI